MIHLLELRAPANSEWNEMKIKARLITFIRGWRRGWRTHGLRHRGLKWREFMAIAWLKDLLVFSGSSVIFWRAREQVEWAEEVDLNSHPAADPEGQLNLKKKGYWCFSGCAFSGDSACYPVDPPGVSSLKRGCTFDRLLARLINSSVGVRFSGRKCRCKWFFSLGVKYILSSWDTITTLPRKHPKWYTLLCYRILAGFVNN